MLLPALAGCFSKPNQANIGLRKEKQELEQKIEAMQVELEGERRVIASLRENVPTQPVLPPERQAKLFATRGLAFGRLTGGADLDRKKPGDEGLAVYIVPTDQTGDEIKAAGTFVVEAFDLAIPDSPLIGRWEFNLEQSAKSWRSYLLDYTYVLNCPWRELPQHGKLTVKVTFHDELTQLKFEAQTEVEVDLPRTLTPATTTSPSRD